jgi:3-methyladenine DNA glycosylase AlkD
VHPDSRQDGSVDPRAVAEELDERIGALPEPGVTSIRRVRREFSKRLRTADPGAVLALADELVDRHRWVAYELVYHHPGGLDVLDVFDVERLGRGLDNWGSVDAFGCSISGPAWGRGRIGDGDVRRWARSADRWWRRTALVSTVPLNVRSRGGTGDPARTLDICWRLAEDRDPMVVKALSWALRELVVWDSGAVRRFLEVNDGVLAATVRREVRNKLETGRKN